MSSRKFSSLKDEGGSGAGGEARAPPIITCRPPRHVQHSHPSHAGGHPARSPISHTGPPAQAAMSPSFSPALSPLATRSPSISPLGVQMGNRGIVTRGVVSNTPGGGHYQSSRASDYGDSSVKGGGGGEGGEMRI